MSYGVFSEVYFAMSATSKSAIKIGETNNARRRANQLSSTGYDIVKVADVNGGEAERLFVEGFLRARINASGKAQQIRKDYFECDCPTTAEQFCELFENWVKEANAILDLMKKGESITFRPAFKSGRPTIPAGREDFYNRILKSCDKCGYWKQCFQFDTDTQYEYLIQMKEVLTPYGYTCTTYRNCSWAHFKVVKDFA